MPRVDPPLQPSIPGGMRSFLHYCRVEKGLAANSIIAYTFDLKHFASFDGIQDPPSGEDLRRYLDSLYRAGLSSRSIARRLATLRNYCRFLLAEGRIATEALPEEPPAEHGDPCIRALVLRQEHTAERGPGAED